MPNCRRSCCSATRSRSACSALPETFGEYLAFVTHALEDNQRRGGDRRKFEVAYFRSLSFDDPPRETRRADLPASTAAAACLGATEYKAFQDFVFRYI